MNHLLIVTGMPGSGKDEFVKVAKSLGFTDVHMGDTVKAYARKSGIRMVDRDIGAFATKERLENGMDIWAKRTAESISNPEKTVVDGLRNTEELVYFKSHFVDAVVIAIYTNRDERLKRILKRNRIDDVKNEPELEQRDNRELGWGIGRTISLADHMIVNYGTLEEFKEKSREFLLTQ